MAQHFFRRVSANIARSPLTREAPGRAGSLMRSPSGLQEALLALWGSSVACSRACSLMIWAIIGHDSFVHILAHVVAKSCLKTHPGLARPSCRAISCIWIPKAKRTTRVLCGQFHLNLYRQNIAARPAYHNFRWLCATGWASWNIYFLQLFTFLRVCWQAHATSKPQRRSTHHE